MNYWPFWLSGLALASVAIVHWFLVGRLLAVSGRVTHLVNRVRFGPEEESGLEGMTAAELAEALQQATAAEFGEAAFDALQPPSPDDLAPEASGAGAAALQASGAGAAALQASGAGAAALVASGAEAAALEAPALDIPAPEGVWRSRPPLAAHLVFFGGLALGGLLSTWGTGGGALTLSLRGETFAHLVHGSPVVSAAVLLVGGVFVGFGTRMAGGCTSGHGLCGVSRFQPGSILATATFFGVGVISSFLLGRLL